MVRGLVSEVQLRARPPLRPVDQHEGIQHSGLHGWTEPAHGQRDAGSQPHRTCSRRSTPSRSRRGQARRRHRQAHGHLAAGHRHDVGVLEDGDAPRRLARRGRRGDAQGLDQSRATTRRMPGSGAQPWWGATATGLPLLGGLMTIDELQRGSIDHALAMAIPHARAGVWSWPATHSDGDSSGPNSLPEGARLRLDPTLNLKKLNLPPMTRMMAEAAQRYGIVIRDRAGCGRLLRRGSRSQREQSLPEDLRQPVPGPAAVEVPLALPSGAEARSSRSRAESGSLEARTETSHEDPGRLRRTRADRRRRSFRLLLDGCGEQQACRPAPLRGPLPPSPPVLASELLERSA